MIVVQAGHPKDTAPAALLAQSHTLMNAMFPADACHYLDLDALCAENIRFFVAREGDAILGIGALALQDGYGEVKSMFTDEAGRGKGVAAAVLRMVEDTAREEGLTILRLETGTGLDAAHRLYGRFGFEKCGPFGSYEDSPYSVFMEKSLEGAA
ncbi:GNAT family N-acetyltransferase [Octadecabacter sp. 1_MG-2023]|uniref:GNAT family N-acetyltransferase n=1 Tax=unclassified Octadecabacter TaxID=196158 RepID=UPI001C090F0F|nr:MULTISPECIES: GNAT family N-acetyltransferase [unclassified Octadecabacter]MBU2992574.1 GNAT family N-acetyltransferase [Octadecabacter sp. B2R22]MDO6734669.1 GNAT family N-acetyltransferase [Octadecabacter sp. 1_MG-2023]